MSRFLALLLFAASSATLSANSLAPVDETSFTRLIASHKGKVVLVNFWATWCGPCRDEMPALARLAARLADQGFVLITISADEADQEDLAAEFLQHSGVRAEAYLKTTRDDDKFLRAVDPEWSGALPASFLYDRSGRKLRKLEGEIDFAQLEKAITTALH